MTPGSQNTKHTKQISKYSAYKKRRKMYHSNHLEEVKGDIRKTWGLIRSVINNDVRKADSINMLTLENAICTDSKKIADKCNDFL